MKNVVSFLLILGAASVAVSQPADQPGPFKTGWQRFDFANKYPGSATIPSWVAYPSPTGGTNAPLDRTGAPYPVVVFGHGFLSSATLYQQLARHVASWGFIFVAHDTFIFGPSSRQTVDMQALTRILRDENGDAQSFFFNAIDVASFGVAGHSMGGASTAAVLASSANVQAAAFLAPVGTGSVPGQMRQARVPYQVLVGKGDTITPATTNALVVYQNGTNVADYRGYTLLWSGCDHVSIAIVLVPSPNANEAFRLSRRQFTAFMLAHLKGVDRYFDTLVGTATHNEPNFDRVDYEVIDPNLYTTGTPKVGGTLDYHVMGKAATRTVTYLSPAPASIAIPGLGVLGLDPSRMVPLVTGVTSARQVAHLSFPIPAIGGLAGLDLWVQSAAQDRAGVYWLTPTRRVEIAPAD